MKGHHFELEFSLYIEDQPEETASTGGWILVFHQIIIVQQDLPLNHGDYVVSPKLVELSLCETVFTWPGRKLLCHFPKNMLLPGALVCYGVQAVVAFLMSDDLEHMSLSSSGNVVGRILEVSATLFTYHHDGPLQIQKETFIVYYYTYIIILYINYTYTM